MHSRSLKQNELKNLYDPSQKLVAVLVEILTTTYCCLAKTRSLEYTPESHKPWRALESSIGPKLENAKVWTPVP